jgi:DNA-binding HxlR family transcriptional regulator
VPWRVAPQRDVADTPDDGPHRVPDALSGAAEDLTGLAAACDVLGDRWSLPILSTLLQGPLRYTEIHEQLPALAPNILTARLRKLERDGVLIATRYSDRPVRFDYRLTPDGASLARPIELLSAWAAARGEGGASPTHADCGTALEARWWCPSCEVPTEDGGEQPILA